MIVRGLDKLVDGFVDVFYTKNWPTEQVFSLHSLTVLESYKVQAMVADKRIALGERVVGYKVGCTSEAIRRQFGISEPICARLFEPHVTSENRPVDWKAYANCAIEPEMAIMIGADLHGEHLSDEELICSIEYVSASVELHDYTFWHGAPSMQELICSGGIHAGLVVGREKVPATALSFDEELFSVYKNDRRVSSSPASEIMGGPLESLRWLVGFLTKNGDYLKAGCLVIPGSPTELIEISQDTEIKVDIERVGELAVSFKTPLTK
jgi:2-keto-4-pentenoate hydratase